MSDSSLIVRVSRFFRRAKSQSPRSTGAEKPDLSKDDILAQLAQTPEDAHAWYLLATVLAEDRDWGWACLAAGEADRLDPEWRQPAWLMADCLARSGMAAAAVDLIEERGWVDHANPDSVYAAARLGIRAHDPQVGLRLLDEVLAMDSGHLGAIAGRLELLRLVRPEDATAYVSELEADASQEVRRVLARDRINDRDPLRALGYLEGAPDDAETHTLRASAYLSIGRYGLAMQEANQALRADPANKTAARWLEEANSERRVTQLVPVPLTRSVGTIEATPRRALHLVSAALDDVQAGYTIRSQAIGEALQSIGWEAHFATPPKAAPNRTRRVTQSVNGVTYHRLDFENEDPLLPDRHADRYVNEAAQLVEELRPAVLHAHSGFTNGAVALGLGEAYGIPVVYEARGFLEDTWLATEPWADPGADRYVWRRNAETRCMDMASAVVTLGEAMRSEIEARGIDPRKISVIPNAVDPNEFAPGPKDHRLREDLGIGEDEIVIGYVTSLRRLEGLDHLIEATARLLAHGRPVRCLIVGDGPERPHLEALSERRGVGDAVVFTGSVPHSHVKRYYQLIDVFVVPRTADRVSKFVTPLKPLEAMAMAKPLLVAALPALLEMIVEGETGLTFSPEDPEDLARCLSGLISDEERREELGNRAREWVIRNRTWRTNARLYQILYNGLGR